MDTSDAFIVLNHLLGWDGITGHAIFILSDDPYAFRSRLSSIVTRNPNISRILESVFIIFPIVPFSGNNYSDSSTFVLSLQDAIVGVLDGFLKSNVTSLANFTSVFKATKLSQTSIAGRSIHFMSYCRRELDFGLYDFDSTSGTFVDAIYISKDCVSATWCLTVVRPIKWPNNQEVMPDECFRNLNCNINSGTYKILHFII